VCAAGWPCRSWGAHHDQVPGGTGEVGDEGGPGLQAGPGDHLDRSPSEGEAFVGRRAGRRGRVRRNHGRDDQRRAATPGRVEHFRPLQLSPSPPTVRRPIPATRPRSGGQRWPPVRLSRLSRDRCRRRSGIGSAALKERSDPVEPRSGWPQARPEGIYQGRVAGGDLDGTSLDNRGGFVSFKSHLCGWFGVVQGSDLMRQRYIAADSWIAALSGRREQHATKSYGARRLGCSFTDRIRIFGAILILVSLMQGFQLVDPVVAASATAPSGYDGFDTCAQGYFTPAQMQYLWNNYIRLYNMFYYVNGAETQCASEPSVNGSVQTWVDQVAAQGWGFVFLWRGLQCSRLANMSDAQADVQGYDDGYSEASDPAVTEAQGLASYSSVPLGLDIEGYTQYGQGYCESQVDDYVNGFDQAIAQLGDLSVIYGSAAASLPTDWGSLQYPPTAVWLNGLDCEPADYNATTAYQSSPWCDTYDSVWNDVSPYISDGLWSYDQRYSQWTQEAYFQNIPGMTFNGGYFPMDLDCANSYTIINSLGDPGDSTEGGNSDPSEDAFC
jgi:hypothetical protein